MDQTYGGDYTGTELDPGLDLDFDFEDDEDEGDDLIRVVGIAAGAAALLGGLMLLLGRRKKKTGLEAVMDDAAGHAKQIGKAAQKIELDKLLEDVRGRADELSRNVDLGDLGRDIQKAARKAAKQARKSAGDVDLQATIDELQKRIATIEREGRKGARRAAGSAGKAVAGAAAAATAGAAAEDIGKEIAQLWRNVSKRARDVGWEDAFAEAQDQVDALTKRARKQAGKADLGDVNAMLDTLRERVGGAVDTLRDDVLPEVQDRIESDVLPGAKKLAGEARKRGEDLASGAGPAVGQAGGFVAMLADVVRNLALDAVQRLMSEVVPGAKQGGEHIAGVMRDQTAPWVRHRADEVRARVADDIAPKVGGAVADAPHMAREVAEGAGSAVAGVVSEAAALLREALDRTGPKVADAVGTGRDKAGSVVGGAGSGIGGAISGFGHKAGDAVGATVDTTKYLTGETSRILFWLSMLGSLILLAFVPDRDKQREIWENVQQFMGELQEMWSDFSDEDFAEEIEQFAGEENATSGA